MRNSTGVCLITLRSSPRQIAVVPYVKQKLSGYYRRNSRGILVPHCVEKEAAKLKYFPKYLNSNCYIDCSVQASLQICGCVPFYYEPIAVKYSLKVTAFLHVVFYFIRLVQKICHLSIRFRRKYEY